MVVLGLRCCTRIYSSHSEWGLLLAMVPRLLSVVASFVREHRLSSVVCRLSCSKACGIFLDQGSDPCTLHGRWIPIHYTTREVLNAHSILLWLNDVQSISTYSHISFLNPVFNVRRMCIKTLICVEHLAGKHSISGITDQTDGLDRVSSYWDGHWLTLKGCGGRGSNVYTLSQKDTG